MNKIVGVLTTSIRNVLFYAVIFQVTLLAQIHSRLLDIPFVASSIALVVIIPQLSFKTDIYKNLKKRSLDTLFFMNTTLFFAIWNSVGNIFAYTKSTINEIKEYKLQSR